MGWRGGGGSKRRRRVKGKSQCRAGVESRSCEEAACSGGQRGWGGDGDWGPRDLECGDGDGVGDGFGAQGDEAGGSEGGTWTAELGE